jgi:hypothetical protein
MSEHTMFDTLAGQALTIFFSVCKQEVAPCVAMEHRTIVLPIVVVN